ncbi:UNVERIFIED_CONTAM: hypothetical protein Slati_2966100 [Sesamum latifolium]|uniref:Uncharacterized protein n=1 Tax=Sesamum latifolium TaxID=2727402 RepID=A0AAW2VF89_9LAMI
MACGCPGARQCEGRDIHNAAALMWTVNDLPAYGMAFGWSTVGVIRCPVCMEDTRAFYMQNSRKACYFDCHR